MPAFSDTTPVPLGIAWAGQTANLRCKEFDENGTIVTTHSTGFTDLGGGNYSFFKAYNFANGVSHTLKFFLNTHEDAAGYPTALSSVSPPPVSGGGGGGGDVAIYESDVDVV